MALPQGGSVRWRPTHLQFIRVSMRRCENSLVCSPRVRRSRPLRSVRSENRSRNIHGRNSKAKPFQHLLSCDRSNASSASEVCIWWNALEWYGLQQQSSAVEGKEATSGATVAHGAAAPLVRSDLRNVRRVYPGRAAEAYTPARLAGTSANCCAPAIAVHGAVSEVSRVRRQIPAPRAQVVGCALARRLCTGQRVRGVQSPAIAPAPQQPSAARAGSESVSDTSARTECALIDCGCAASGRPATRH
jgi:hypothetical protein